MVFYNKEDLEKIERFAIVKNHGPLVDIDGYRRTESLIVDDCKGRDENIFL